MRAMKHLILMLVAVAALGATSAAAQPATDAAAALTIAGDVSRPTTITMADMKAMPRASATIQEDGHPVKYEGVLVSELLKRAGVGLGRDMTGNALSTYVLASAKDGYEAVFSLAELDPGFTGSEIIVADSVDGKPLFDYQGPFRIVAPKDTRGARGVRMLLKLEVVRLKK
jgi:DMSO/TMAO reductase YedYZ molybdopterin-dependent catalytic subunit